MPPLLFSMSLTRNFLLQDDVVTKPFRINELLPKMLEVIQRVKMNDIQHISTESTGLNDTGSSNTSAASTGLGYSTLAGTSGYPT
jgi:DNA-binding response OmpR family regulator